MNTKKYIEYYNKNVDSVKYCFEINKKNYDFSDILCRNKVTDFVNENKELNKNNIYRDIESTMKDYGLDMNFIMEDYDKEKEKNIYKIPKVSEKILALMIWNSKNNVIKNKKEGEVNLDDIIQYNERLNEKINKLPTDIQYNIKSTETYKFNQEIQVLLNLLLDRTNLLLNILLKNSDVNAGNQIKRLITYIDKFLYSYAMNRNTSYNLKNEAEANYLFESVLKQEFLKSIKENIDILDFIGSKNESIEQIKKDLNIINKVNTRQNYRSEGDDLKIYYNSKLIQKENNDLNQFEWKNIIDKQTRDIFEKQSKNIKEIDEEVNKLKNDRKIFFNNLNHIDLDIKEKFYNLYIDKMIEDSLSFTDLFNQENIEKFKESFKENLGRILHKYRNANLIESIFHKYPDSLNIILINIYQNLLNELFLHICYYLYFNIVENKKYDILNDKDKIKNELRRELDILFENEIEQIKCYFDNINLTVMTTLFNMYYEQKQKDEKINKIKREIGKIKSKEKNKEDIIKQKKLEEELKKYMDIRSPISEALSKTYIASIYNDSLLMKKEKMNLKQYLRSL